MNIKTKATNLSLSPAITDYLEKKLVMLEKFIDGNDSTVRCDVELAKNSNHHKSGDMFRAEINLHVNGKDLYAFSEKETINAAIDEVKDEILAELKNYKTKKTTLLRRGAAKMKNIIKGLPIIRRWN